ncbi:unnamed protein product [Soboliphyme baturini]|uniref:Electron transfer flavoprotein subunit alpha n=1 Tax=Soboliphyme baturini TaxID=241478 RepID=A0A183IIF4_9BILA|nr:unnamed protein product [Soboliphyme baturini]
MPGHMGSAFRPLRGIQILRINFEYQIIYVKGYSVPGSIGNYIYVKDCWIPSKRVEFSYLLKRSKGTLVLAECSAGHDLNLITLNAISAAAKLGDVSCLVVGENNESAASKISTVKEVQKVLFAQEADEYVFLPHIISSIILNCHKKYNFDYILGASSTFSKAVLPRVAAKLDMSPLTDITEIKEPDTFVRAIYAGNVICTVKCLDPIKVITVRHTAFQAAKLGLGKCEIENVPKGEHKKLNCHIIKQALDTSERPDLANAKIVVSGGRGLKNKENFKIVYDLADALGAAVGGSRAVVDAGFLSNDLQIGQTGKIIAPELYIAVGISGAIQHIAGIRESKTIVAINKDADAPIHQFADFSLTADLFEVVPKLTQLLKK